MCDEFPEDAPAPRLCHLIKWPDFDGYGFNLHAERSKPGQFIGKIDDASPAQLAGLREGDRIVEVNGVNINNENHCQVVERIKSKPNETKLLVVDVQADLYYKERELVIKSNQSNVVYIKTPTSPSFAHLHLDEMQQPRAAKKSDGGQEEEEEEEAAAAASKKAESSVTGSLDNTSDFNDDSIEVQVVASKQKQAEKAADAGKQVSPPPMSPDSGKGDEEVVAVRGETVVVVEAEINNLQLRTKDEQDDKRKSQCKQAQDGNHNCKQDDARSPADSLTQASGAGYEDVEKVSGCKLEGGCCLGRSLKRSPAPDLSLFWLPACFLVLIFAVC